jgi:hypothetical protein
VHIHTIFKMLKSAKKGAETVQLNKLLLSKY